MECKYHSGQEADLICMECGQPYCRECVKESREAHYCPDCHRASVERLAAQMGGRKEPKPVKVKEPKPPKEEKVPKEKKLRKPAEVPMGPTLADLSVPPPVQPAPPPPSLTPAEKAEFWGDKPSAVPPAPPTVLPSATAPPPPPAAPPARAKQPRPAQAPPARPAEPLHVEGLPPPIVPVGKPASRATRKPVVKRPVLSTEEREAVVMASEGFPTAGGKKTVDVAPAEPGAAEEELVPRTRRTHTKEERRIKKRREPANLPVAMQVPMDYDGEVTADPRYLRAILWALGAGLVLAGAYTGITFWLHKDYGIFAVIIGFAVGLAMVFGSGRHFSWKLGLIAVAISLFWVSVARVAYGMLDVRFNDILPLKLGIGTLFKDSLTSFGHQFGTLWLLFFILTAAAAFLISFRPWPVRLQMAGTESGQHVARKSA